jgi:alcohol dehydrogenase class IV
MFVESTTDPLAGHYRPTQLQGMYYGADSVERHLLRALPSPTSRAFIITGNSLATKTSLIKRVEALLGSQHAGTFSNIRQHSPIVQLDEILHTITADSNIDTVISIGGGSPIDSSKALSHRLHEREGRYLTHIAVPTTLSAAECTMGAGLTDASGLKTTVASPRIGPKIIIYDAKFARETPASLWMSTGFRAMDHAVELMYHPAV